MKYQQEIYTLTTDSEKKLSTKVAEFEEKIKNLDGNHKKLIDEKENIIKDNTKKLNNLNILNASLENNINQLKTETSEKAKKICTLEGELAEANKNAINAKTKYESLQEKLEREFNGKNVKNLFYCTN
jgi:hypothetical protein